MLADGADKISWKFFTLIFISADTAAPDGFSFGNFWSGLWFGFDMILVVGVGGGWNRA